MLRVIDTRSFATLEAFPLVAGVNAAASPSGAEIYAPLSGEDAVAVFETGPVVPSGPGLVSEWRADGVPTDAASGRDAVARGPVGYAAGRIGQAFAFDGRAAFLEVPEFAHPWIAGGFTASAFVSFESLAGPGRPSGACAEMALFDHRGGKVSWRLLKDQDNRFVAVVDEKGASPTRLGGSTAVVPGRWYHVALVHDAGELSLYVDGEREARAKFATAPERPHSLYIGALAGRSAFLHGRVDEVRFYERALTPAEIRRAAASTL
jgi:hypothetical protein